jgi:hypothetical protein
VKFTRHAREQMVKRGITEDDVKLALNRPIGDPFPGDLGNIRIDGRATKDRILSVVYPANSAEVVVVTVYWQQDRATRKR